MGSQARAPRLPLSRALRPRGRRGGQPAGTVHRHCELRRHRSDLGHRDRTRCSQVDPDRTHAGVAHDRVQSQGPVCRHREQGWEGHRLADGPWAAGRRSRRPRGRRPWCGLQYGAAGAFSRTAKTEPRGSGIRGRLRSCAFSLTRRSRSSVPTWRNGRLRVTTDEDGIARVWLRGLEQSCFRLGKSGTRLSARTGRSSQQHRATGSRASGLVRATRGSHFVFLAGWTPSHSAPTGTRSLWRAREASPHWR